MRFSKYFSKGSKQNQTNHVPMGRSTRMEKLEDRRVLAVFMVNGNGDSIQDAIDDAINKPGPDTVLLKSDTYYQEVNIAGESSELTILGAGNVTLRGSSKFGDIVDIIDNSGKITLKNLTIRNPYYSGNDNVDIDNSYKVNFYNVHSVYARGDGVDAQNLDYFCAYHSKFNRNHDNGIELGPGVDYAYLRDVQASNNDGNGVWYDNYEDQQGKLDVYSGDFSKNDRTGIFANDVEEVYIDTIYANDNKDDGIEIKNGDVEIIDINYAAFDGNGDDGMDLDANDNNGYIEVTTTRAHHNNSDGLEIDESAEAYVHNSSYSYNGDDGLDSLAHDLTVDYIDANHNDDNGLEAKDVDDLSLYNSEFLGNSNDGIQIEMNYDANTVIDYVEASYNEGDGVELSGEGYASLITVGMRGNNHNGLRSVGLKYLYVHNSTATNNGYDGVRVIGDGNRTDVYAFYNNFSHNNYDGFYAEYAGNILLKQLRAEYNSDDGVDSNGAYDVAILESPFIRYNFDNDIEIDP